MGTHSRVYRAGYAAAYRLGFTPWEHHGKVARASVERLLDREAAGRPYPPGRVLDLGCGRGQYAALLAGRGWEVVGVDNVPHAVEAAALRVPDATFLVADVTDLAATVPGRFDLFLDAGCFQGLTPGERLAAGRGVAALATAGATLLVLAFQPTWMRSAVGGVSREEIETAFPSWEMVSIDPADTRGLGWPLTRTAPQWYRLRRSGS